MFLIASVIVLAFSVYAYISLRLAVLDEYPLPIFGLLLVAAILALVQVRKSGRRWVKLVSAVPILLCFAFVYCVLFLFPYGPERPVGPTVGQTFPAQTLSRAIDGQPVPVGLARAEGRLQLVLLFRGFW